MNALEVKNLKVIFPTEMGIVRAVEGIDIEIEEGKCAAIVGESGCGKSVTSLAVMKLLSTPPAVVRCDKLMLGGIDIRDLNDKQMQKVRGKDMAMIFQDALTALNPVMTIGKQIDEIFLAHNLDDRATDERGKRLNRKKEAKRRTIEALKLVGISDAEVRYKAYPHQLSGGMRQRVLIAMAFACNPNLIIADEPTTALDVTIQAQVLDVLKELQRKRNTALMLITHDLSIVMHMADEIYVMYCGKIVERAKTRELFKNPLHPYTMGLLGAIARIDDERGRFVQIPSSLPSPIKKPSGCYFHPRCQYATEKCKEQMPPLETLKGGRCVRCWNYKEIKNGKNG
mgnify:CR=1 FL=1